MERLNEWAVRFGPGEPGAVALVCFPHAGGGASAFRGWHPLLSPGLELVAVQLPGREQRLGEVPLDRVEKIAAAAAAGLEPGLEPPYALYGHSLGALVAFEVARELRRRGHPPPERLIVAAHPAPQLPRQADPVSDLPDAELLARVAGLNGIPAEVLTHEDLVAIILPALRADFAAAETYAWRPEDPLACPISAFRGERDPTVTAAGLDGWAAQTAAAFAARAFDGDHFFPRSHEAELVGEIAALLAEGAGVRRDQ